MAISTRSMATDISNLSSLNFFQQAVSLSPLKHREQGVQDAVDHSSGQHSPQRANQQFIHTIV